MALRIIAGDLKGRKLRSVCGIGIRPTANRTREAIFNILASRVPGSSVLDLFAGTGAFGIEALVLALISFLRDFTFFETFLDMLASKILSTINFFQ